MARHRLQRLASPSRTASLVLHLVGLASFTASFRWLFAWDTMIATSYGSHFQFLTIIGLLLSYLTFTVALFSDITGSAQLFAIKNTLSVCSAPLEVLIAMLYWGLRVIDKRLVVPEEFELEWMVDLGFHLVPAVMLFLDLILVSPPWTVGNYAAMSLSTTLAFLYWGWIEWCFSKNGWYPYPIFALLSTPQRVLLFSFSACLMTLSTMLLKWAYGIVNGIDEMAKTAHKPLQKVE